MKETLKFKHLEYKYAKNDNSTSISFELEGFSFD